MKASTQMRTWFAYFGYVIWPGIILTGLSDVHWALYIPAAGMTFAAIAGICPSQIGVNMLIRSKQSGMKEVKLPADQRFPPRT